MLKTLEVISSTEEFLVFKTQEQEKGISVRYENENLWMTQKAMAELFDVNVPAINKYLNNISDEGELSKNSTKRFIEDIYRNRNVVITMIDVKNFNKELEII